jgi:hypothetical protein
MSRIDRDVLHELWQEGQRRGIPITEVVADAVVAQRRQLRAYRIGRQIRFRRADVDALLAPVTTGGEAGPDLDDFIRQGSA